MVPSKVEVAAIRIIDACFVHAAVAVMGAIHLAVLRAGAVGRFR